MRSSALPGVTGLPKTFIGELKADLRDVTVSKTTGYGLDDRDSIPVRGRKFFLHLTSTGALPSSNGYRWPFRQG